MFFSERTGLQKLLLLKVAACGSVVEDTATGNPLTFLADLSKPLKSLVANFLPVQASGTPSLENELPITGWTGVNVWCGGRNITEILKNAPYGTYEGFGFKHMLTFKVKPNTDYTLSSTSTGSINVLYFNGTNSQYVGVNASNPRTQNSGSSGTLTVLLYDRENIADYENGTIKVQLEEGSVATPIDQYEGTTYPVTFPSTIYGGYVDLVTGEVWATYGADVYDGSNDEQWNKLSTGSASAFGMTINKTGFNKNNPHLVCDYLKPIAKNVTWGNFDNWISYNDTNFVTGIQSITTVPDWREYLAEHNLMVAYELASPVLITTLTSQQITAIKGNNTIWSDANGEMTAVYLKKG